MSLCYMSKEMVDFLGGMLGGVKNLDASLSCVLYESSFAFKF